MSCTTGIAKNITSDCSTQPVGGIEVNVYVWNRADGVMTYDATNPNKITAIDIVTGKVAYKIKGIKKNLNCGHDRVISEELGDTFKHFFSLVGFEFDSPSVLNLDALNDLAVVVEYKQKHVTGDGVFVGYGLQSGLYVTTDTRRANDNNGVRKIELTSRDQEGEPFSQYNVLVTSYAATKTALEALLV